MLRKWGWVPRVIALVVVGLAAFTIPYGRTRNLVSECHSLRNRCADDGPHDGERALPAVQGEGFRAC